MLQQEFFLSESMGLQASESISLSQSVHSCVYTYIYIYSVCVCVCLFIYSCICLFVCLSVCLVGLLVGWDLHMCACFCMRVQLGMVYVCLRPFLIHCQSSTHWTFDFSENSESSSKPEACWLDTCVAFS